MHFWLSPASPRPVAWSSAASSEPPPFTPRFSIESAVDCSGPSITFSYDDHVDGHVPLTVHETLHELSNSSFWTADEVHQVNGDYFNERTFPTAVQTLDRTADYVYEVSVAYDDGVHQIDGRGVNLAGMCGSWTSPTTIGTLPETGSSNITWLVAVAGVVLLSVGAALFAGARMPRSN